jgi:hypothetical protein
VQRDIARQKVERARWPADLYHESGERSEFGSGWSTRASNLQQLRRRFRPSPQLFRVIQVVIAAREEWDADTQISFVYQRAFCTAFDADEGPGCLRQS